MYLYDCYIRDNYKIKKYHVFVKSFGKKTLHFGLLNNKVNKHKYLYDKNILKYVSSTPTIIKPDMVDKNLTAYTVYELYYDNL